MYDTIMRQKFDHNTQLNNVDAILKYIVGSTQAALTSPGKSQKGYGVSFELQKGRLFTMTVQTPDKVLPIVHITTMSREIVLLDKIV